MSYWAEIDDDDIVIRVTVGNDNDENQDRGYKWLIDNLGGTWVETFIDGGIRKNFAGIGYIYDKDMDIFYIPKPFPSWILNESAIWEAPIPIPQDEYFYAWNEETLQWEIR